MIRSLLKVSGVGVLLALLSGCGETKELTLYLQEVELKGPVSRLPVHITRDPAQGQITISPSFWVAPERQSSGWLDGHSPVNTAGVFSVDTVRRTDNGVYFRDPGNINTRSYTGRNLTWITPTAGGALDVDLGLSERWALSLGGNYSVAGGEGLWGYHAGLGIRSHKGNTGFRLEVGWQWQSLAYRSVTLASERTLSSSVATVAYFEDTGLSTTGNMYATLTINGANPDWTFNPYLQVGVSSQTMEDYRPKAPRREPWILPPFYLVPGDQLLIVHDLRQEFKSTRVHVTPGLYLQLEDGLRLVAGGQVSIETVITDFSTPVQVTPFLQLEWTL